MQNSINNYLSRYNLDIRRTHDARFMDQKVTPDVLCIVADCVVNYIGNDFKKVFTVQDIWDSEYFNKNVKIIFNKPDVKNPTAKSEYDKFIQQPLKTLSYAHILNCEKRGNINHFQVENYDLLRFISIRDRNAWIFLYEYLIRVLRDSGFLYHLEHYKKLHTEDSFSNLKNRLERFIIGNTNIKGKLEADRIFPKILNIYAAQNNLPGTVKGRMSRGPYYHSDLMYNRINWRDKKNKNITRQETELYDANLVTNNPNYDKYLIQKAKAIIRDLYRESEVRDQWANGEATQIHHIFPGKKFPALSHYVENLIKLTPTQHFTKAHPNNTTNEINRDYQLVCLLAKSDSIERSLKKGDFIYRKENFIYVINMGLSVKFDFASDFKDIKSNLISCFK